MAESSHSARARVAEAYGRYVAAVCAHPARALLLLALVCTPALALSASFFGHLDPGLQQLLPPGSPSVKALNTLHELVGGRAHLTVIAHSPDRAANEAFIAALTERLEAAHLPEVESLQGSVKPERAWLLRRGPLLMPAAKFDELLGRVDKAAVQAKFPLDLGLGEDAKPEVDWQDLEHQLDAALGEYDRFPRGYLELPDGSMVVAVIWMRGSEVEMGPASKLMDGVQQQVKVLHERFPAVQVAYNGEVPNLIEEHAAILADLSLSSVLVVVLVGACIAFYFKSLRAVLAVVLALAPGLLFTFALGRVTVGGLNSNTAFLGTIIAGNGINYPLLMLAYFRAQPASEPMAGAMALAVRQALPGTLGAALTASAAYGGLAVSDFRGFSQFGWLGGSGMLIVWLGSALALPILVAVFAPPRKAAAAAKHGLLGRFLAQRQLPNVLAGLFVLAAAGATTVGVTRALHSGVYEDDLQVLRNRDSLQHGSASWDQPMNRLFGVWLNPVVGVALNPEHREPAAESLRRTFAERDPNGIQDVETIERYVPPQQEQERRLTRLRHLAPALRELPAEAPPRVREALQAWLAPESLQPITAAEVPGALKQPFTEKSGRTDRLVLVYPSIRVNYNDARNLERFDQVLKQAPLPPDVLIGGGFLFMAEILRLVRHEALHVVLVVCAAVGLLLLLIFRGRPLRALASVLTMALVAFCAQAALLAVGVKVNLLNFAALPITIGVGSDYVVNLFGAMDSLHADARAARARMGGAILLCSLTTVIGYLSLLVAESGALRTFGWAAVLGEAMAVATVLLVVPAALGDRLTPAKRPVEAGAS